MCDLKKLLVLLLVVSTLLVLPVSAAYEYTEKEGDKLYEDFKAATAELNSEEYEKPLNTFGNANLAKDWIVDYGIYSAEEWETMSTYDRACYYALFAMFCKMSEKGDYNYSFADEATAKGVFCMSANNLYRARWITEQTYNEFEKIIMWQYNFFINNGDFYDFENKETYFEHKANGRAAITPPPTQMRENGETDYVAISKEKLKDKTMSNIYLMLVIVILVALWYIQLRKRKKENREMDDNIN